MGASIVQSVPGAIVAGSGNLYNPATTSAFSLTHSSPTKYDTIVLQTKTAGVLDTNGVVLQYAQNGALINLPADRSLQIASASGMFGSTFIHYWEWNVQAESISNITILFNAVGPHLSLDEVRLDTLNVSEVLHQQVLSKSTLLEPLRKVTSSDLTVLAHLFQETHCLHSLRARVKPMSSSRWAILHR